MKILGIAASVILMTASGALATEAPAEQTAQTAQTEQTARQDKRVCKSEKITGSLTRVRRTCMTQAEWDRLAEGSRDSVNDIIRDSAVRNGN